jgi:hypothetical protein
MRPLLAVAAVAGCVTITPTRVVQPFEPPPAAAAQRLLQSRRYDTRDEAEVLRASASLLMDLGFTVDASDELLGVLVASKDRTAVVTGQMLTAMFASALFGTDVPYDHHQKLRASIVTRPTGQKSLVVRATFQRIVWNSHGLESRREALNEDWIYLEFFGKLSKALFLEAHDL